MDESRFEANAKKFAQLLSRRTTLYSMGAAGIASALEALVLNQGKAGAKRKKRKKKCKLPRGKCGKKCKPLNTNENCGRCGKRCGEGESCLDGVCCPYPLCRGECRPDCPPPTADFPFPQERDYGAGTIKPNNFTQEQLNDDVRAAYDRWKGFYLVDTARDQNGNQVFRIAFGKPGTGNHAVTTSEGQGYGMIIVATMAGHDEEAREIFDGLWRFRLAHPSDIDPRLMDWRVPGSEGNDSAFDGDADIAYALLLAHAQWGSDGLIGYLAEALQVIAGIRASTIGPDSLLPMLGDWTDPDGAKYNQYTPRTSDFIPGHFRAYGRAGTAADAAFWNAVVAECQDVIDILQGDFSPDTGLLPDFAVAGPQPAPPGFLEGTHDGDYNYNAGRDPWRLGTDALLNSDATSAGQAGKIAVWADAKTNGNPQNLRSGYELDGSTWAGTDYFTTFFVAPIGVAAMTDLNLQDWLNAIYDAVHDVSENYYEDTVTLLCMLVMTGNFWDPT